MRAGKPRSFERMFNPRTVAVIGASPYDGFSQALMSTRLRDTLFLINPKHRELHGRRCFASILDVEGPVDYAIIAVPAMHVPSILAECIEKGVETVHVFTAGFSETGIAERKALEAQLRQIARGRVDLIGPNCLGICCPKSGLAFMPDASMGAGPIGVISQSGTFAEQFLSIGKFRNLKFSKVISYGNAIDLDCPEFLEYLAHDPETRVIALYVEGTKDGNRLKTAMTEAARLKPVLALKGGLTEHGSRAASSHTGSLAGSPEIWRSLFRQAGAIQVKDFDELLDATLACSSAPLPSGKGTALITNSGGFGVLETDLCVSAGLKVPQFMQETTAELRKLVPLAGTSITNPLDAWPIYFGVPGKPGALADAIRIVSRDTNIQALVLHFDEVGYLRRALGGALEGYLRELTDIMVLGCRYARDEMGKTVMACVALDAYSDDDEDRRCHLLVRKALVDGQFPVYPSLGASIRALANVYKCSAQRRKTSKPSPSKARRQ